MRLSDRYIFGELLMPFFIGTFALLMMMVGTTLYNMLESILRDHWPPAVVARVLLLNIPAVLVMALPVATALAASLATNRMANDREIIALRATGTPLWRIFMPILLFGALTSALSLWISDRVVPWASREQTNIQFILDNLPKNPVEIGTTFRVENYTISFRTVQRLGDKPGDTRRRLTKVIAFEDGKLPNDYGIVYTADVADYENGVWTLPNAHVHTFDAQGFSTTDTVMSVKQIKLTIDFSQGYRQMGTNQNSLMSFDELTRRATEAKRMGQLRDAVTYEVDRWFKLSLPLMCFVFALCAPPLALRFSRGGSFTGILLSIVTVFVAWNTLLLMRYVGLGGLLHPQIAAWSTNVLFTILGVSLLRSQE